MYETYIAQLENSLSQNKIDISQIKKDFQEKNHLIQQKMEDFNLILVKKDSLLQQDSLIAVQKILLANNQHKMKEAYYQIKTAEYRKNMMVLALIGFGLTFTCLVFYWNNRTIKKQKKQIEVQNQDLKIINEELDQFSYRVSHDIRAPIASMMGLVNISRDEKAPHQLQLYFNLMEKSLKKLDEFIKDILTHSQSSRTEVEANDIVLQELIEEIIAQYKFSALENNIDIRLNIEQNAGFFYSDAYRLKIILNNLIANSIRYFDRHKAPSFLEISGRIDPQSASLRIQDNGVGIAEEHLQRVFDMFYRANANTKGSGLGLYIVKQSVKKIGGEIKVNSRLGEGTSFHLEVPNMTPPSRDKNF